MINKKEKYGTQTHLARFPDQQACLDFIIQARWGGKPKCSKCGNIHMNYFIKSRMVYKCSACKKQFAILKDTIFEKTKTPLVKWFETLHHFFVSAISSYELATRIEVTQRTAWYMLHRIREACKSESDAILSGWVQVDESIKAPQVNRDKRLQMKMKRHFEKQNEILGIPNKRINGKTPAIIKERRRIDFLKRKRKPFEVGIANVGMVDNKGRVVLKKVGKGKTSLNEEIVVPILVKHIDPKSIVWTDGANIYNSLPRLFKKHQRITHKKKHYKNKKNVNTNSVENVWRQYNLTIETYRHISYHHADRYNHEFTYRWNRKKESVKFKFEDFMNFIVGNKIEYKKLIMDNPKRKAA